MFSFLHIIEPRHEISNNVVCVTSKCSDHPVHTRSLIRAFTSRLNILWVLSYSKVTGWTSFVFLSWKGGCTCLSECTLVKMPHCLKSYVTALLWYLQEKLSLGALPQSRFLLAHLGLLVSEHHGQSLSLLLNSGVLALSQTILRLVGKYCFLHIQYEWNSLSWVWIRDYKNLSWLWGWDRKILPEDRSLASRGLLSDDKQWLWGTHFSIPSSHE